MVVVRHPPYVYLVIAQVLCYFRWHLAVRRRHPRMVPAGHGSNKRQTGPAARLQAQRRRVSVATERP